MGALAALALTLLLFAYIFWRQKNLARHTEKTRHDYLEERRSAVYDNLRDLSFEHQAGKYPEEDYLHQRAALEEEAAVILTEMDVLSRPSRTATHTRP